MNSSIIRRAKNISIALFPEYREMRTSHFGFLIRKNRIIKIGWNKYKTHRINQEHPYHDGNVFLHAETDTLIKAKQDDLSDFKLLVLRISEGNVFRNSRPCFGCQSIIKQFGIKEVWHSDSDGDIIKLDN
jgi:deoxycytidylate deaminase